MSMGSEPSAMTAQLLRLIKSRKLGEDLDLHGETFTGVDISGVRADHLNFSAADLRTTKLHLAHLSACKLDRAQLTNSNFSSAILRMCSFDNAHGENCNFDAARLEDSSAVG